MSDSNVTYSGQGQTTSPIGSGTLDPSNLQINAGGARLVALYSAWNQLDKLKDNLALATNYYNTNKQDFDFWNANYSPNMLSALNESKVRPFYTAGSYQPEFGQLDYLASTGRGQSRASLHIDKEWLNTRRKIGRYNIGHGRRIDYKYSIAKLNSEFEGWNLGFRYEDHRKMLYDEQRHAHQAEILNLGIGAGNAAREGLATSTKWVSEARAQKAGIMGELSNGLATYAGFKDSQNNIEQRQYNRKGRDIGPPKDLAGSGDQIFSSGMGDNG